MVQSDIYLIAVLSIMLLLIIGLVILIVLWFKSNYRKKDLIIRELQKEIEELKRKHDN